MKLTLDVRYPDGYPDTLPELSLEPLEGDLEEHELQRVLEELNRVVSQIMVCLAETIHLDLMPSRGKKIWAWR